MPRPGKPTLTTDHDKGQGMRELEMTSPTPGLEPSRGRVQRIYVERGFGFIRCLSGAADDVGQDFFFHHTGLDGFDIADLEEGSLVVFEPTYVAKGKRAERIQRSGA